LLLVHLHLLLLELLLNLRILAQEYGLPFRREETISEYVIEVQGGRRAASLDGSGGGCGHAWHVSRNELGWPDVGVLRLALVVRHGELFVCLLPLALVLKLTALCS
jgi:hypothetical protein